ncbi:amidohydrolase family protein [Paraburkholderia sp. J41]|uniref:amidohydrolase family protein n=1 Tax=Paraburkholderia sp. J41 TaxID=2805433 RepID=UPI002AC351FE|nr:amidohydrolase family protein [Paraburkholderia sp. J41]
MTSADRIDVHQHVVPPFWAEELPSHGGDPSGWHSPDWSPEAALQFMDQEQIATGVLSLTAPAVKGWDGAERRDMARRVNEYTAELVEKYPDRFGNFATLPLPDVESASAEAEFALTQLKADGVVLLTSYDGVYLGDASFAPLWEVLNQHSAVVFIHPGAPAIKVLDGMPGPVVDYPFDTTRTAVHLAINGMLDRYPNPEIILSHAGGFLPYAAHRFAELLYALAPNGPSTEDLLQRFGRFNFDTALSSGPAALPSLLAFSGINRVLYGSDFPYAPPSVGASFTVKLDRYSEIDDDAHAAINNGNARRLFPRLSKSR